MFKDAFKLTFKGNFLGFFFGSSVAPGAAFLLLAKNAFGATTKASIIWAVGIVMALVLIRFLWFLGKAIVNKIHNTFIDSIWGEAIKSINDINAEMQCLRKKDFSTEEFIFVMHLLCDNLKTVFDSKTKSDCCVSIKIPVSNENTPVESFVFENLCRDRFHGQRDTDLYMKTKHTVIGNTPFTSIINNIRTSSDQLAYINNNISQSQDYLNTSRVCYSDGKLPYNSELVYPIIPLKNPDGKARLLGFICVDCKDSDVFDKMRYDIPVVSGVADSIYDIIQKQNNKR